MATAKSRLTAHDAKVENKESKEVTHAKPAIKGAAHEATHEATHEAGHDAKAEGKPDLTAAHKSRGSRC